MEFFYGTRISENLSQTPEGFLVATGSRLCRSGVQKYYGGEIGLPTSAVVRLHRSPREVTSVKHLASLEGKPLTDGHPPDFLNSNNASWYTRGHVQNVRVGEPLSNGDEVIVGDLVITDAQLIAKVKAGLRELSVGYEYSLVPTGNGDYEMRTLRANHLAVVEVDRAGKDIRIMDAAHREDFESVAARFLGRNATEVKVELDRLPKTELIRDSALPMTPILKEKPVSKGEDKLDRVIHMLEQLLNQMDEDEDLIKVQDSSGDDRDYEKLIALFLGRSPSEGQRAMREAEQSAAANRRGRRTNDKGDPAEQFEADCKAMRERMQR